MIVRKKPIFNVKTKPYVTVWGERVWQLQAAAQGEWRVFSEYDVGYLFIQTYVVF